MSDHETFLDAIVLDRSVIPYYCNWLADREDPKEEAWRVVYKEGVEPVLILDKVWNTGEDWIIGVREGNMYYREHPRYHLVKDRYSTCCIKHCWYIKVPSYSKTTHKVWKFYISRKRAYEALIEGYLKMEKSNEI